MSRQGPLVFVMLLLATPAHAAVSGYTDWNAFEAAAGTLTSDDFEAVPPWQMPLSEPVASRGASYTATQSLEMNVGGGRSGSDGITDQDLTPHALDAISIGLPANARAAGGWVMNFGGIFGQADDIVLSAYDGSDQLMGSVTLPDGSTSEYRFVGLTSDDPIARVEFRSTGDGGLVDDDFVLDDVSFEIAVQAGPPAAPLLAPWALGLLGAGLLLLARRFG